MENNHTPATLHATHICSRNFSRRTEVFNHGSVLQLQRMKCCSRWICILSWPSFYIHGFEKILSAWSAPQTNKRKCTLILFASTVRNHFWVTFPHHCYKFIIVYPSILQHKENVKFGTFKDDISRPEYTLRHTLTDLLDWSRKFNSFSLVQFL